MFYYLSNSVGTILARTTDEVSARATGMALAIKDGPVALHAVVTVKPAPVGGSVSMVGVMEWFPKPTNTSQATEDALSAFTFERF